jgi:hypothetical protein
MQISGANLIASQQAAQQGAKTQSSQATKAGAHFMAALAQSKKSDELFAPLNFQEAQPPRPSSAASAAPAAPPQGYDPGARPGTKLDIRV